jgi:hypothetical protein
MAGHGQKVSMMPGQIVGFFGSDTTDMLLRN